MAVRYPNLAALGSDVAASVRRNFDELKTFFKTLRTLDLDTLNERVSTIVFNVDNSNDRNPDPIEPPTIATDGSAVDHTTANKDGSTNISFEWSWSGTEADIDGWLVYVRSSTSATAYVIGTSPEEEQVFQLPPSQRYLILRGQPIDLHYTFGVQAFRGVDLVIAPNGIIKSPVVQPSLGTEDPYQPSTSVAFAGDVTGTVNNIAAATVTENAANGNTAYGYFSGTGSTLPGSRILTGAVQASEYYYDTTGVSVGTVGSPTTIAESSSGLTPAESSDRFLVSFSADAIVTVDCYAFGDAVSMGAWLERKIGAGSWAQVTSGYPTVMAFGQVAGRLVHYGAIAFTFVDEPSTTDTVYYRVRGYYGTSGSPSVVTTEIRTNSMSVSCLKRIGTS